MNLTTEADLAADVFHLPEQKVAELRRQHSWPHVRLGRFDIRYTDEQVAAIVEMHTKRPGANTNPSAKGLPGQTPRSQRRAS